ncbi:MAG TPA: DUF4149 domain-containing protein [Gemmatimonadaceae bacterium]|nr:DUF4149 domain-containing protein [Gemmatimonadaceae bacterium]
MSSVRAAPALWTIVLLSAWLGAVLVFGVVVAPAAFAVLPSRTLAGALVGRVLPALFWSGALLGVLIAAMLRRNDRSRSARLASGIVMTLACLGAQLVVAPQIEHARVAAAGPIDALAPSDPRRVTFGRLHGESVGLLAVAGLAAASALLMSAAAVTARPTLTLRESLDHG